MKFGNNSSGRHSFTLTELVLVTSTAALLAAVAPPLHTNGRDQAGVRRCSANLSRLGQAIAQYGQDFQGYYPTSFSERNRKEGNASGMIWSRGFGRWDTKYKNLWWHSQLNSYVSDKNFYFCPVVPVEDAKGVRQTDVPVDGSNYAFNGRLSQLPGETGRKAAETEWPDVTPLISERKNIVQRRIYLSPLNRSYNPGYATLNSAHTLDGKAAGNVLMADLSVKMTPKHKTVTDAVKDTYEQERD
ncbi:MAG: hypothetical protein IJS01_06125 [Lentisphaeria bacterium]|nr:hypothetical protein [Lentisphaeria bacterium]